MGNFTLTPSVPTPSVPTPSVPTPSVPTPSVPTPLRTSRKNENGSWPLNGKIGKPGQEEEGKNGLCFMILRGCYRAQKPLKPKNTKKLPKEHRIPHPKNHEKNTEQIQDLAFLDKFCNFSLLFSYFVCIFSYVSRISGFRAPQDRNRWSYFGIIFAIFLLLNYFGSTR